LVLGLLAALKLNQSRGVPATQLFETGRVFMELNGTVQEYLGAAFLLCHNPKERSWLARSAPDFYTVKQHLMILAQQAGIDWASTELRPISGAGWGWQAGHAAVAGESSIGWSVCGGLLDLPMVRAAGVEGTVWAGMLAILPEKLTSSAGHRRYQSFGLFPTVLRDLALVVAAARSAEEVRRALLGIAQASTGSAFAIEAVEIFDVYQGQGLPEGKKSLGFSLSFRSQERTLTDDEVNAVFTKIQQQIVADGSITVRA
jgi:phenylalanyl-tRNA synthetase beta chain